MATGRFESLSSMMEHLYHGKRVTYRTHGLHGELRRPMIHRFEVKGGETVPI